MTNGEDKVIDAEYQKLNDEKAQIDEKVKKIDKSIQVFSGFGWLLICAGVAAASFPFFISCFDFEAYGGYIGGAVSSLWSLAGLMFIYVAFLGQKQQLLNQQLEIKFNQYEVRASREELKGQKEQLKDQNLTLRQQKFENTFFELLKVHQDNVKGIQKASSTFSPQSEGRISFKYLYEEIIGRVNEDRCMINRIMFGNFSEEQKISINPPLLKNVDRLNFERFKESVYIPYHQRYLAPIIGNYFVNLYHLIKFVDESQIIVSEERKYFYVRLVRAQLSGYELLLLFYSCLTKFGQNFRPLIHKYALFNNIDFSMLLTEADKNFYDDPAYNYKPK